MTDFQASFCLCKMDAPLGGIPPPLRPLPHPVAPAGNTPLERVISLSPRVPLSPLSTPLPFNASLIWTFVLRASATLFILLPMLISLGLLDGCLFHSEDLSKPPLEGGSQEMENRAKRPLISSTGSENLLKLTVVMVAHIFEQSTKKH